MSQKKSESLHEIQVQYVTDGLDASDYVWFFCLTNTRLTSTYFDYSFYYAHNYSAFKCWQNKFNTIMHTTFKRIDNFINIMLNIVHKENKILDGERTLLDPGNKKRLFKIYISAIFVDFTFYKN